MRCFFPSDSQWTAPVKPCQPAIVIVGPTASGKSDLAQIVAERLGCSVLSADSMQVYRGMDIGTGKVTQQERRVPHFGLDLVDPGQPFSAALFQEYGRSLLERESSAGKPMVVCGGTGFYVRALIDDFQFPAGEQVENPVLDERTARLALVGPKALWEELRAIDPLSAEDIHPNDSKRVIRAFEMLAAGESYHKQKEAFSQIDQLYPAVFFGLGMEPKELNARIDRRVEHMVASGLVEEVQHLLDYGFRKAMTAREAIGYKEIVAYLDGEWSLDEAVEKIKTATHQYAKRQRTWFRKDKRIHWLDAGTYDAETMARQVISRYEEAGGGSHEHQ